MLHLVAFITHLWWWLMVPIEKREHLFALMSHIRLFFQEPNIIVLAGRKKDDRQTIFSYFWSKILCSTKLVSFFSLVQRSSPTTEESIHILFNDIAQWHEIEMVSQSWAFPWSISSVRTSRQNNNVRFLEEQSYMYHLPLTTILLSTTSCYLRHSHR